MAQERRKKRRAFVCEALIDLGNGSALQPCHVLDISDGGARLLVGKLPSDMPVVLTLWVHGKVRRACTRAWQRGGEVGVRFLKGA
jgi:hypothetical protein